MQIFDEQSKNMIMDWAQSLKNQIEIKLITTEHVETNQFINFTKKFTETTSKLTVHSEKGENDLPCFLLKKNIKYSALPLSKELKPFLESLSHIKNHEVKLAEPIIKSLDKINIPVNLKLYIALECPHCPNVVRTIIPMAIICENLHLQIIDGTLFPETAQKDGVMSAPCLILDDDFRWTGEVTTQEIIEIIINRDPSQLSATSLKNILEQGDASWIARQMMEKGEIFDGFIQLLLHETWSVRLGAMVIVEELAETDPKLAAKLCPELIALFDKKEIPVQGDILYVLGEAGNSETKKWINNKINTFEHQDLIDAANDALEALN